MWIPDSVYELLPLLYGMAGMLSISFLGTVFSAISAMLFLLAAFLVFTMRRSNRNVSLRS